MVSALKELLEWGGGRASPHRKLKAVGVVRHRARHPTVEDPGKDSQRREHLMGAGQIDVGWRSEVKLGQDRAGPWDDSGQGGAPGGTALPGMRGRGWKRGTMTPERGSSPHFESCS